MKLWKRFILKPFIWLLVSEDAEVEIQLNVFGVGITYDAQVSCDGCAGHIDLGKLQDIEKQE